MLKILFLHGWHSAPGGVKPTYLKNHGHSVINPTLNEDDFDAAVRIAQAEYDQHQPDVIVGSSRGGAVAMNIDSKDTPVVLLCPAWKKWGTKKVIKPNTIILHSKADETIPFEDSLELLAERPSESLVVVGNDHRLADEESLRVMLLHIRALGKPASFAEKYPRAYHVFPLHALKSISKTRKLLSKADLFRDGISMRRNSTSEVDEVLGLSRFIHLYLPKDLRFEFESLPILKTQLKPSPVAPFPHVVMELATKDLVDWQCGVCNFNAAVSRPAYGSIRGGNHSRGMKPEGIVKHWHGFRCENPEEERMRRSFWHDGIVVPLLLRSQITEAPNSVGYKSNMPELLLFSPFALTQSARFHVFSRFDLDSANRCSTDLPINYQQCEQFEWYGEQDRVNPEVRQSIDQYLQDEAEEMPVLNYDCIRRYCRNP